MPGAVLALLMALAAAAAFAHPMHGPGGRPAMVMEMATLADPVPAPPPSPVVGERASGAPYQPDAGWRYDDRFQHARYYPAPGLRVGSLPAHSVTVEFRGEHYWFDAGVWFRGAGRGYVVCEAPVGASVPALPSGMPALVEDGISYYYVNGAFYAVAVASPGYVVVPAPDEAHAVLVEPRASRGPADEWQVLPLRGQDQAQLFTDRAGCSRVAAQATSFDPVRAPPAEPGPDLPSREARYRGIEGRCLAARGYLVR